ncbi:MbnP family protein [Flavobacterium sp. GT3R68]|uniref:MbnP family protein n=1 Tax=Flavobacterium sp. GT3R68 TaxID=2594437 RepID=UPI000F8775D7|nr:MbnP family protein [Flavobacterium sp. GT3R68]RTY93687.1 hypothetical protein EKL32_15290 [Flavobacterium sp. GSN2]TRW91591.1 hypothetical protein FNW07_06795 [Flavobacterium sp. GT3R68]
MIKKTVLFLIFGALFFQAVSAQIKKDSLIMHLNFKFGKLPLEPSKTYISENKDTLQIDLFKFYLSDIQIFYSDHTVFKQQNSYHLIDIENPDSNRIPLCDYSKKKITKIIFNIGIDSLTSVSGAMADDLDPTKGMYWAWQSGYINMKLEGRSKSCKTRKNAFQFHIGGYLKPEYAMRTITLEPKNATSNLELNVGVATLFSKVALSEINSIMIPGKQAMKFADYSIKMFSIE